ncbi:hypothetical protein HY494_03030 [Candidatus Woesearchaeota archaeon]|nr:hypothetical protein [Candidatus Woesearchaeota archaeon]
MKRYAVIWLLLLGVLSMMVSSENQENQENKTTSLILSANLAGILYLNTEYTSLFKIEIKGKSPCSPQDKITVVYNLSKDGLLVQEDSFIKDLGCTTSASTGKFIPLERGNYTLCGAIINSTVNSVLPSSCAEFTVADTSDIFCDINLQLKTNESIFYENGQSIEFKPELNNKSFPFVIEYWIEDLFSEIVKPKVNTTNNNQKSWKTNIGEEDRVLFINAVVYPGCNDTNKTNNVVKKMFIVTKNEATISSSAEEILPLNSTINITEVSPETVSFGEVLDAEIETYKGATTKYSVSLWAEKNGKIISEKTKVHLKNKNTLYQFTLPVQIEPNCDEKIKEGTAQLVVEGLGLHAEKEFTLEGINEDLCQDKNSAVAAAETKSKNHFEIIGLPTIIYPGESLLVKLKIQNDQDADFAVWSYLFRGNKCYSCSSTEREGNKISFSVDKDELIIEELQIEVDPEISEGEYTLMVKYKKDDQKTENSITQKINVKEPAEANSADQTLLLSSPSANSGSFLVSKKIPAEELSNYEGIMVYESTAEKSKNLISWVLFIAFGLLSLALIIKRN